MAGKDKKKRSAARAKKAGAASSRRNAAARERRAEDHAKLINERIAAGKSWRERKPDGSVVIHLDDEGMDIIRDQLALFVKTFGREPQPGEPVFFDPDFDRPTPISIEKDNREFRAFVRAAGVSEAYADVYEELGYLVTDMNIHTFNLAEIDAFSEALARHEARRANEQEPFEPE